MSNKLVSVLKIITTFITFLSVFIVISFTSFASIELVSKRINILAAENSTTNSLNLNFFDESDADCAKLLSATNANYQRNVSNIYPTKYLFRTVFDSSNNTYFSFSISGSFSGLLFATSGTHKNPKGENINDWYELKMAFDSQPDFKWGEMTTIVNIRESVAKMLFESDGLDYTREMAKKRIDNYWFLDATFVNHTDIQSIRFQVNNIIIEEGNDTVFHSLFGDYITLFPNGIVNCSNYATNFDFGCSERQNRTYLSYLKEELASKNNTQINKRNLVDKTKYQYLESSIVDFLNNKGNNKKFDGICYLASAFMIVANVFFVTFWRKENCSFVYSPLIFAATYLISKYFLSLISLKFFSKISILIVFASALYLFVFYFYRCKKRQKHETIIEVEI